MIRLLLVALSFFLTLSLAAAETSRPRVIVSTDIGGTDPDDFQSMVHLLLYADVLDIEGLISSPFGLGTKQHILRIIDLYEQDYANLSSYSSHYPSPSYLRSVTKQGEKQIAPYQGFSHATEGSRWIIERARAKDPRPLHILVWGGIEDLAQALHDAPDILPKLRVYYIGGPNKKWTPNAYHYIATQHPNLWIIENNASYRGWFTGGDQSGDWGNQSFVKKHIASHGALGQYFATNLEGTIKMGDTPSVAWLLKGNTLDPSQPGWGGQFVRAWTRPYQIFTEITSEKDQIEEFSIAEFSFPLPAKPSSKLPKKPVVSLHVENQEINGFIDNNKRVKFRFSPKAAKVFNYSLHSNIKELDGIKGAITAVATAAEQAYQPDAHWPNWWVDNPAPEFLEGPHIGAKTVNRWRKDFLTDFAQRMSRVSSPAAQNIPASAHSLTDSMQSRVPNYTIDYSLPNVEHIQKALTTIRQYYESTSSQIIFDAKTGKEIKDFSRLNKNSKVSEGFSSEWSYTHGVVLSAFDAIDYTTDDDRFFANNTKFFNWVVSSLPYFKKNAEKYGIAAGGWKEIIDMHALDHCGSIGAALIKTYQKNLSRNSNASYNEDYLALINTIADYISHKQFRLPNGTLARHRPQYQSIWADDIYMSVPFLANAGSLTGEKAYFDDAARQIIQMAEHLYIPEKELFDHGWHVTAGAYDPHFFWARANGWTLMSMVELLSLLPEDHIDRNKILHLYRSMVRSLAGLQDASGFWHNMLDQPTTFLETSATAMFSYAIAKGVNEGWLSHIYAPVAITAWNAVHSRILANGAVDGTVEATTLANDNVYYQNRGYSIHATHGYGPTLYAGAEIIRLLENKKLEISPPAANSINSTIHVRLKSEWPQH